ncbi:MAG TPA: MmcQ/YjbR family DNA-binding protein, partial [Gaiellaceae bacterium]|nr:MmcQ/YjbR family DNA-binding protein [Gaiellaceae bacterium]
GRRAAPGPCNRLAVVTPDEIRALAQTLPRSYEVLVHGQIKFRVGQIVWLALSKDGERMGCGFPREMRQAAVEAEPHKFQLPGESDLRFNWIHVRLEAIDADEMRDLVEEAWSRAVPLYVAQEYGSARGYR